MHMMSDVLYTVPGKEGSGLPIVRYRDSILVYLDKFGPSQEGFEVCR